MPPTIIERAKAKLFGDDAERLAARRELKADLAKQQAIIATGESIAQQQRLLAQREQQAVDQCETTTAPLRERLLAIEEQVQAAILAGEEVGKAVVRERLAVLQAITEATSKLEAEVDAIRKLRRKSEVSGGGISVARQRASEIEGKLKSGPLASHRLLNERFALTEKILWLERRVSAADRQLDLVQSAFRDATRGQEQHGPLEEGDDRLQFISNLEREFDQWKFELDAARCDLETAQAERDRIRQAILDE